MTGRLAASAGKIASAYSDGSDRPLGGYLTTMSVYSAVLCALAGAAALSGTEVPEGGLILLPLGRRTYRGCGRCLPGVTVDSHGRAPVTNR